MLTIRSEQMEVFRRYMTERFEKRLLDHIRRVLPTEFDKLGEEGALKLVRMGMSQWYVNMIENARKNPGSRNITIRILISLPPR